MVLLFYVYDCLIFSPSEYKMDEVYASIQAYFKIEDDGDPKKYLGIELDCRPYSSIYLRHPYLTQINPNMIPGTNKSSANPTPAVNPPKQKMRELKQEKRL